MRAADWIVVILYFAYVIREGLRHGRKNADLNDYFRGKQSLRWWAVGLSVMATQASAITYIGTTGQAYGSGMTFIQFYFSQPVVMVVLCMTFVPFFYRANVFTAYEYLERRFDAKTRSLTSFLFLMSRGLSVSIVLYAPAIVLGVIFGWSEITTVLVMGLSTILYTSIGGNKAVIMIDAKQMILMFAGIFVALGLLVRKFPSGVSLGDAIHIAGVTRKWTTVDLSLDLNKPYTLLSGMLGGFFLLLSYFGCDQSQVQRYLAAHGALESLKGKNRDLLRRVMGNEPSAEVNYVFPSFLLRYAPAGVLGIMLAVIFAAAMSSFASEINSLASATIIDFYKRYFRQEASDSHYLWTSRAATLFWGIVATTAACFAGKLGSLIEAVNRVGSYFYGPILGVFLLAFLVRRSNGAGAFWGLLAGEAAVFFVAYNTSISWLYYNVVGAAAVLLAGTLISFSASRPGQLSPERHG